MTRKPTFDNLMMWREALASCAIESNQYAIGLLELWKTDRPAFIKEYWRANAEMFVEATDG